MDRVAVLAESRLMHFLMAEFRLKSTNSTIYLNMFIVLFHLLHIIVADDIQIHTGNPVWRQI
jgi:hypothetical protein